MDCIAMMERQILVIGYGAIASELVAALLATTQANYRLGLLLRPGSTSRERAPGGVTVCESIEEAAAFCPDLVVEAAGHGAVSDSVPALIQLGLPVLISSIGALHDQALLSRLLATADAHGGRLILASGALGGLDYLRAVRGAGGLSIGYESRKQPAAWAAELKAIGRQPEEISRPLTLFKGTAREAASIYPQNLNVGAAVA